MSWRDKYLPASFRGVPFYVRGSTVSSGRRQVVHEYPGRDVIDHEDLGSADTTYSFDAYVLGDDYFKPRDKLENTFKAGTKGRLIHPFRGAINVVVDRYTITETAEQGGIALFSITFLLDPEPAIAVVRFPKAQVEIARQQLNADVLAWFENAYSISRSPLSVIKDARAVLGKAIAALDKAKKAAAKAVEFKRQVSNLRGDLIAIVGKARALAFSLTGIIEFGIGLIQDIGDLFSAKDQLREQREILEFTQSQVVSTPAIISEDSDYPAKQIQTYIALGTVSASASLITQAEFKDVASAEEEQASLFATIDRLSSDPTMDDDVFVSLRELRKAVYEYIQFEAVKLPRLIDKKLDYPSNTLALSYEIYGNLSEADDIAARNRLEHPGFVPINKDIQLIVRE